MKCFEITLYLENSFYIGYLNYYSFARTRKDAEKKLLNYWVRAYGYMPRVVSGRLLSKEEVEFSIFEKKFDINDFERR